MCFNYSVKASSGNEETKTDAVVVINITFLYSPRIFQQKIKQAFLKKETTNKHLMDMLTNKGRNGMTMLRNVRHESVNWGEIAK